MLGSGLDAAMKLGELMASGKVMMPEEFQNNPADCTAVVIQAMQWNMNPFMLASEAFVLHGKLSYSAKVVGAVINSSDRIKGSFKFKWFGDWSKIQGKIKKEKNSNGKFYSAPNWEPKDEVGLGVTVSATLKDDSEPTDFDVLLVQAVTRNSTLWADDPRQQLAYLAQKKWARLYAPELTVGIYSNDELDEETTISNDEPTIVNGSHSEKPNPTHTEEQRKKIDDYISRVNACKSVNELTFFIAEANRLKDEIKGSREELLSAYQAKKESFTVAEQEPQPETKKPGSAKTKGPTHAQVMGLINKAKSTKDVDAATANIGHLSKEMQDEILEEAEVKINTLVG